MVFGDDHIGAWNQKGSKGDSEFIVFTYNTNQTLFCDMTVGCLGSFVKFVEENDIVIAQKFYNCQHKQHQGEFSSFNGDNQSQWDFDQSRPALQTAELSKTIEHTAIQFRSIFLLSNGRRIMHCGQPQYLILGFPNLCTIYALQCNILLLDSLADSKVTDKQRQKIIRVAKMLGLNL